MDDITASAPVAREYVHALRRNLWSGERTFRLTPGGLEWSDGSATRLVGYGDIVEVREYKSKVWGALSAQLPRRFDYVLGCRDGSRIVINSVHHARFRIRENRMPSCVALMGELNARVAHANPDVKFSHDLHWSYRLDLAADRVRYRFGLLLWKLIRHADFDRAANLIAWTLRRLGPRLRGHRTARANLTAAYPDKSPAEIEQTLSDMWDSLGRLAVEYINLDKLVSDTDPNSGRIVVAPGTLEKLARLRDDGKPAVLFTSHLASYEVGAIWTQRNGLDLAILYNRSNFGPLSEQLDVVQKKLMGRLVPAGPDSAWRLRDALKAGYHLALFADQHFGKGVEVTFFGRACKVNPMAARFAQMFDCPVHGFRTIRLPGNRIQVEFTDAIELPRGADGRIDAAGAMQTITSVVEGWVREHPEQWLWQQRRWR
jgi:KDO2-lipid IV(A) lauroyltransferase